MEKEVLIDTEAAPGDAAPTVDESRDLRRAEEQIRMHERDRLVLLKDGADARRTWADELAAVRTQLEAAQVRIGELEGERDEIQGVLEKFLAENWGDLTEKTPVGGVPTGLTQFLARTEPQVPMPEAEAAVAQASAPEESPAPPIPEEPAADPLDTREALSEALRAGATIETTDSFSQFEPVKTSHIKISDWLAVAHDYRALQDLAGDEFSESELMSVLFLFRQKAFIRVDPS